MEKCTQPKGTGLYIGIMSGTSVDGIDVALIDVVPDEQNVSCHTQFVRGESYDYLPEVRQAILDLCESQHTSLTALGELTEKISKAYADAVNEFIATHKVKREQIVAIGVHGQTVCHQPSGSFPFSMQLVNPALIAAVTQITTVHDFRSMDIALGGQGAPLVPLFHQTLLDQQSPDEALIFLNIGGISNISVVNPSPLSGFDTGPGNVLLDAWINKVNGQRYDTNGEFSASGRVNESLLTHLMAEPYFQLPAPKSTGRELFNLAWLEAKLFSWHQEISDSDVMATLVELTTRPIAEAVKGHPSGKLLVCGGGAKNTSLMKSLARQLPDWQVVDTDSFGINADFMEAMAFAWLAYRCINRLPGNAPEVTGASRAQICGSITYVSQ